MKKKCFVVMGFGEKTDYKTSRKLNLDKTYGIIRKAVVDAGLECIRADDIIHSGVIDKPMYENLLDADIVIADLSTSNENAIYELGVRHALKPSTTIIIAEDQFRFPFDLNSVVIRSYQHLGTGIDYEEAESLKDNLVAAIQALVDKMETDSPVYTFLTDLNPPTRDKPPQGGPGGNPDPGEQPLDDGKGDQRDSRGSVNGQGDQQASVQQQPDATFSILLDKFHEARDADDFSTAMTLVETLRQLQPDDTYLIQQHALVTYKGKQPDVEASLREALRIIEDQLAPTTSSDPETLGIWGAIHKRLWDLTEDLVHLNTSIEAYERGYYLRRDYYTGINYAFMLNVRAHTQQEPGEAIADFVIANRVRNEVVRIADTALSELPKGADRQPLDKHEAFWIGATKLEALVGLGQPVEAVQNKLFESAPASWMQDTAKNQLKSLSNLLFETQSQKINKIQIDSVGDITNINPAHLEF